MPRDRTISVALHSAGIHSASLGPTGAPLFCRPHGGGRCHLVPRRPVSVSLRPYSTESRMTAFPKAVTRGITDHDQRVSPVRRQMHVRLHMSFVHIGGPEWGLSLVRIAGGSMIFNCEASGSLCHWRWETGGKREVVTHWHRETGKTRGIPRGSGLGDMIIITGPLLSPLSAVCKSWLNGDKRSGPAPPQTPVFPHFPHFAPPPPNRPL